MRNGKPAKIWVYLILINGLVFCTGFGLFLGISIKSLRNAAEIQTVQNLKIFAHVIKNIFQFEPDKTMTQPEMNEMAKRLAAHEPLFRITLLYTDGTVIADSDTEYSAMENHLNRSEIRAAAGGAEGTGVRISTVSGRRHIYYAIPFAYGQQNLILRLSIPLASNVFFSSSIRTETLYTAAAILAGIILISFAAAGKIIKSLRELGYAAGQYRNGHFEYSPSIHSPAEFADLAENFRQMALTIRDNIADIAKRREHFESVFAHTAESLIVFDKKLQIQEMNRSACALFNNTAPRANMPLISAVRNTEILSFVDSALNNQKDPVPETEITLPAQGGNAGRHMLIRCSSVETTDGQERYLLICTDITRLKQSEQIRKDFVANVSHELKTPVTSIKGFTETLLDGALQEPDTAEHFLQIIDQQAARLINIIEDLLSLSRLEQDGFILRTEKIPLKQLMQDVSALCLPDAAKKETEIHIIYDHTEENALHSLNQNLFIQVLENIISNAVKYSPPHSRIDVCVAKNKSTQNALLISIEDNGPGIPEQYRSRIFERFFRVDKGRSREAGGTGLGLSIVKHIVAIHGGTVRAQPRKDGCQGSRFEIYLPSDSKCQRISEPGD